MRLISFVLVISYFTEIVIMEIFYTTSILLRLECLSEVNAARTTIDRTEARFGLKPERLLGDTAYGSAEILGWMVDKKAIEPHVALWEKYVRDTGD